jgi:hypothetical protein
MIPMLEIVEADDEGWIPWSGGECPLPDWHEYNVKFKADCGGGEGLSMCRPETNYWAAQGNILAYRPILKTAERVENYTEGLPHSAFWKTEPSVFDRLKSAVAASESIPGIIAEIDALLPDGYCVAKREAEKAEQPAEDMSDWRNWRAGNIIRFYDSKRPEWWSNGIYEIFTSGSGSLGVYDDCSDFHELRNVHHFFSFRAKKEIA